jgi:UDP-N-acetylglucosamine--N-acetylmuramyl-(pentapeptide) pyrophosphoryl-undecaprenol N-acetylglucosamine transferase
MAGAYAKSDLLVCRAGASTVSEVCSAGVAAIFVPYPHAVDDHQRYNAEGLVEAGAAIMVIQSQLKVNLLGETIASLDREQCKKMAEIAKSLSIAASSEKIKQVITDFIV